jgi:hypothetical protein
MPDPFAACRLSLVFCGSVGRYLGSLLEVIYLTNSRLLIFCWLAQATMLLVFSCPSADYHTIYLTLCHALTGIANVLLMQSLLKVYPIYLMFQF